MSRPYIVAFRSREGFRALQGLIPLEWGYRPVREQYTEDRKLVARLVKGDERAFDFFVDQYYPRLFRFAYSRIGRDADAAQDVVQNTFANVIRKIGSYRGEAALFTWLCSFCRYEIAAFWRQKGRREPEIELIEDSPHARAALETLGALSRWDGRSLRT